MSFLNDWRTLCFVVIISSLLLTISYVKLNKSGHKPVQKFPPKLSLIKRSIDLHKFNLNDTTLNKSLIAFGVVDSKTCPTCISEMLEYSEEITKIDNQFFDGNSIGKILIVTGNSINDAKRFIKAIEVNQEWFFLNYSDDLSKIITDWPEANSYSNQWLFIDPEKKLIISRVIATNATTPILRKRSLLNQAIFATTITNNK